MNEQDSETTVPVVSGGGGTDGAEARGSLPASPSFREEMIDATMKWRGCDRAEAEVIVDRVGDRLAGYSHAEVEQMHPLPEGSGQ